MRKFIRLLHHAYDHMPQFFRTPLRLVRYSHWCKWILWKCAGFPHPKLFINEQEFRPRCREALNYLKEKVGAENIGDYLEFGVCQGSTLRIVYDEVALAGLKQVRFFGFDSFEGLPSDDEGEWEEGSFSVAHDVVVKSLDDHGVDWNRVSLVKGFYSDSLTPELVAEHNLKKASLIMIDCDLYSSTVEALNFCLPLIVDEAVIIFDDWHPLAAENKGEKRAFDEFLQANPTIKAVEAGTYDYLPGDLHGKLFKVTRQTEVTGK